MCVLFQGDPFCGAVWFLKIYMSVLSVYFFILLYIDSTACVGLVYFCLIFDMKMFL